MFTVTLGIFLLGLLASMAGGYLGAAIGGNFAFALTGFMILFSWGWLIATGSETGFKYVAFGPFMGPHVTFAAGVAGAAYAFKKGYIEDGKDATTPLVSFGHGDVMLVGSAFGVFGYLFNIVLGFIPWLGTHIDTVACTVFTSGVIARLMFGRIGLVVPSRFNNARSFFGKIAPNDDSCWLRYQEKPSQYLPLGFFFGTAAAAVSVVLANGIKGADTWAQTLPFAMSAITIGFLILGAPMPVQHHITIIGGLAAVKFMPVIAGSGFHWGAQSDSHVWMVALLAVLIGGLFGMISAFLAEFQSQLFHARGTTHIDPPAAAIWTSTFLILTLSGN